MSDASPASALKAQIDTFNERFAAAQSVDDLKSLFDEQFQNWDASILREILRVGPAVAPALETPKDPLRIAMRQFYQNWFALETNFSPEPGVLFMHDFMQMLDGRRLDKADTDAVILNFGLQQSRTYINGAPFGDGGGPSLLDKTFQDMDPAYKADWLRFALRFSEKPGDQPEIARVRHECFKSFGRTLFKLLNSDEMPAEGVFRNSSFMNALVATAPPESRERFDAFGEYMKAVQKIFQDDPAMGIYTVLSLGDKNQQDTELKKLAELGLQRLHAGDPDAYAAGRSALENAAFSRTLLETMYTAIHARPGQP